jgi:YVTN family beta-propeller protein
MKHSPFSLLLFAVIPLWTGCVQDPTSAVPEIPLPSAKGVYVVNEGNFGRANASLSYFDLASSHVYTDVFSAVNGKNLGDVAAGMTIRSGRGYIIVNNSQKIEVIDLASNVNVLTIPTGAGSSPRQMAFVSDSLALVTDLYGDLVRQVNPLTGFSGGAIPVGANPEGIVLAAGRAYVANSGFGAGTTVSVISLATLTVTKTIRVADNPVGMCLTPGGLVYVVCGGSYGDFSNPNDDTPAKIMVIDPAVDRVVDSVYIGGHATAFAVGTDGIGYVPGGTEVLRIDTRIHAVTGTFVAGSYYGIGVDAATGDVYLSDPRSYVQPGAVSIFAPNGQLRRTFDCGLIPGSFAFKR